MESLGAILQRLQKQSADARSELPAEWLEQVNDTLTEPACPVCKDTGFVRYSVPTFDPAFGKAHPCTRCAGDRKARAAALRSKRLPEEQRRFTFETLSTVRPELDAGQFAQYTEAVNAARLFAEGKAPFKWLLLAGNPGWGKTHLAVCICNWRIDHATDIPGVAFAVVPDMLAELRDSIAQEDFESTIKGFREVPLLILDDLGKENPTAWGREQLYRVVNHRSFNKMETVITTNTDISKVESAIADRVGDEHRGFGKRFALDLPSYRTGRVW